MTKPQFALYLEELAYEIRGVELNLAYLDDMYASLMENTKRFYNEAYEYCRLKSINKD